jgi:hypothetical protein
MSTARDYEWAKSRIEAGARWVSRSAWQGRMVLTKDRRGVHLLGHDGSSSFDREAPLMLTEEDRTAKDWIEAGEDPLASSEKLTEILDSIRSGHLDSLDERGERLADRLMSDLQALASETPVDNWSTDLLAPWAEARGWIYLGRWSEEQREWIRERNPMRFSFRTTALYPRGEKISKPFIVEVDASVFRATDTAP